MIYMDRRSKAIRGTFIAIAIICLIFTISGTYARYSNQEVIQIDEEVGDEVQSDEISRIHRGK